MMSGITIHFAHYVRQARKANTTAIPIIREEFALLRSQRPVKIQSSIISSRLLSHLEKVGIETQYGCVPGKGYTDADALFTIKTALQT
eukprot:scaffold422301_cov51-Attheya_sp.AAC.1